MMSSFLDQWHNVFCVKPKMPLQTTLRLAGLGNNHSKNRVQAKEIAWSPKFPCIGEPIRKIVFVLRRFFVIAHVLSLK